MPDRDKGSNARNRDLIVHMAAPPTRAQMLAELDLEISNALHLSTTANLPSMVRLLRMAKLEVCRLRQRPEYKEWSLRFFPLAEMPTSVNYFTLVVSGPLYSRDKGEQCRGSTLSQDERGAAMNYAFKQACARLQLTGATPVVELVAVRILELVRDGEFDADRLTDATVATFGG